jgi:hypothetical protein
VRLILSEQIYRACTIIKNEKYHHSWYSYPNLLNQDSISLNKKKEKTITWIKQINSKTKK